MSSYPPDPELPREYPPDAYSGEPRDPYAPAPGAMSGRVVPPAVALLIVAILNLLSGLGCCFGGYSLKQMPPAQFEELLEKQNPKALDDLKKQGNNIEQVIAVYTYGLLGTGVTAVIIGLITILGAVGMMMQRWYGLAVFAAVLTAIPCISPTACCLLGEGAGIWALVVLLNTDVRAAFR